MTTPTVYVICDKNCKFEGMTKEQILTAIMQAVNEGTFGDIDAGFITTIKTINGKSIKFFYGEQAAYNELSDEEKENLFAIITNDTTITDLAAALEELKEAFEEHVNFNCKYPLIYSCTFKNREDDDYYSSNIDLSSLTVGAVYLVEFNGNRAGVYIHGERDGQINLGEDHLQLSVDSYTHRWRGTLYDTVHGGKTNTSGVIKFYQMGAI